MPRVVFARINRRTEQPMLAEREFREDMRLLAEAVALEAESPDGTPWVAADMQLDPSEVFLTGILGFVAEERLRKYAPEVRSWKKGETRIEVGASRRTLSPFAIDTRSDQRWMAFVPTFRINPSRFARGFEFILARAVSTLGLMAADWAVDLIPSRQRLLEWLGEHPDVARLRRTVKVPNPGIDLSEEIEEMRALAARTKREEYVPRYNKALDLDPSEDVVRRLLEGVDRGDIEITVRARSGDSFNSARELEEAFIDDWEEDWDQATGLVLDTLRRFVEGRPQQQLPEDGG